MVEIKAMKNSTSYLKVLLIIYCFWSAMGCETYRDSEVKLELLNKHIFFKKTEEKSFLYSNDTLRANALNIVEFKITNNSADKLLFVINKEEFRPAQNFKDFTDDDFGYMKCMITPASEVYFDAPIINVTDKNFGSVYKTKWLKILDYINRQKLKYGYEEFVEISTVNNVERYNTNAVIVGTGESRTFKVLISLPIVKEFNEQLGEFSSKYYVGLEKNQQFQIFYNCDADYLASILPVFMKEELKSNNVKIYNGVLRSNSISLESR